MLNKFIAIVVLALLPASAAFGQSAFIERKHLSTDAARIIVDTCLAYAAEHDMTIGVAVVNTSGVLLDFHLM